MKCLPCSTRLPGKLVLGCDREQIFKVTPSPPRVSSGFVFNQGLERTPGRFPRQKPRSRSTRGEADQKVSQGSARAALRVLKPGGKHNNSPSSCDRELPTESRSASALPLGNSRARRCFPTSPSSHGPGKDTQERGLQVD